MTLLDLAIHLRRLRSEYENERHLFKGIPAFISFVPGQTQYSSVCNSVGEIIRAAYLAGAFEHSYFNDIRPRMIDAAHSDIAVIVLTWLHNKGFPVAGIDPRFDSFERLARAFETIASSIGVAATSLSPTEPSKPDQNEAKRAATPQVQAAHRLRWICGEMITRIGEAAKPEEFGDVVGFFAEVKELAAALKFPWAPIEWVETPHDADYPLPASLRAGALGRIKSICGISINDTTGSQQEAFPSWASVEYIRDGKKLSHDPYQYADRTEFRKKAILFLTRWIRALDGIVSAPSDPDSEKAKEYHPDSVANSGRKRIKQPSNLAFAAYRLHLVTGHRQADIAEEITRYEGTPVTQGQVSRWLRQVQQFLHEGNVLPDPPKQAAKAKPVDPSMLDIGERTDHRTSRQRGHKSEEE